MKAYTFDKLASSVNDVKCSKAVVWEFINNLWYEYIWFYCALSL